MRTQGKVSYHRSCCHNTIVMEITFNGAKENIPHQFLGELLDAKGMSQKTGIAVAINERVVFKNDWNKHALHDNDTIIVIKATQGG